MIKAVSDNFLRSLSFLEEDTLLNYRLCKSIIHVTLKLEKHVRQEMRFLMISNKKHSK